MCGRLCWTHKAHYNNWLEIPTELCPFVDMNTLGENPLPDEPLPTELEMILDETNIVIKGRPLARSPEQGITDMGARIEFLTAQIGQITAQVELKTSDSTFLAAAKPTLDTLAHDLRGAEDRLKEYQAQLQGRN